MTIGLVLLVMSLIHISMCIRDRRVAVGDDQVLALRLRDVGKDLRVEQVAVFEADSAAIVVFDDPRAHRRDRHAVDRVHVGDQARCV